MKTRTTNNPVLRSSMALAVMIALFIPASAWSASHAEGKGMMMDGKMMEKCGEMRKEMQKMREKTKAQDAELTAAVATMNNAAQDEKLDLVAGVVTRLVEQRAAMHAKKAQMQEKMMKHMMDHMQAGRESMSECPMMKGMNGTKSMDEKPPADHQGH